MPLQDVDDISAKYILEFIENVIQLERSWGSDSRVNNI